MFTLDRKLRDAGIRACVAYYHLCTNVDDWGTEDKHWLQILKESPATGYITRFFIRVKDTRRFKHHDEGVFIGMNKSRGVLIVTYLQGQVTEVNWYLKPKGRHKDPLEDYIHRDGKSRLSCETNKPEGYGEWA